MTAKERKEVIDTMRPALDHESDPKVGIFWYDPDIKELFGVVKSPASLLQFNAVWKKTAPVLHKHQWEAERKTAQRYGGAQFFEQDYTAVPRGRVFEYKHTGFKVFTGSWILHHPEATSLILSEFSLESVHVEWVRDEHWDIGRGWSEEFI